MSNTTMNLQSRFEKYPNVSIRKLAAATNINYGILLKLSKQPIAGEAYDPEAINWTALEQKFAAKNVDLDSVDWDALNAPTTRNGATLTKDLNEFNVGDRVYMRKNSTTPYTIVYKTATHIVVMLDGTSEPQAWSNNTFLLYGPSKQPRANKLEVTEEVEEA